MEIITRPAYQDDGLGVKRDGAGDALSLAPGTLGVF